jgi:ABC-type transport system involved in multi-copper enzyme maturation permease subunit
MNPMIRKELQQRMRERRGWIIPTLYLLVLGAIIVVPYYSITRWDTSSQVQGAELGLVLFLTVSYAQLALLLLFGPVFSAGSLTIEKEQRTLAGLLTSLLTVRQIWFGKFASSLLFVLLLLITGLPVLSLAYVFGGLGLYDAAAATLTTVVILLTTSAIGLYCSSAFRRSVHATAAAYGAIIVMTVVTAIVFFVRLANLGSTTWNQIHWSVKAPMYLNPFYFLTVSFAQFGNLYPEWTTCLIVYFVVGVIAVLLTIYNVRRSGESA